MEFTGANSELVDRAAVLIKADLCTEVVKEFPELQGKMGRGYALLQGEHPSVAVAIEDHYKPCGPSDSIPEDKVAVTLALADKLDSIINFWSINEKPSGSKDPYALRRAALGFVRIILERGISLSLLQFVENADLISFFHDRLKSYLYKAGNRYDIIDAVLSSKVDNFLVLAKRVKCLNDFLDHEEGKEFLSAAKRVIQFLALEEKKGINISKDINTSMLFMDVEKQLYTIRSSVHMHITEALETNNFSEVILALSTLHKPIDFFFAKVMVNVDE